VLLQEPERVPESDLLRGLERALLQGLESALLQALGQGLER
jgi:hypothetical protein